MENLRRFISDIDGVESELKIEITEENGFPDYPIDSTDDEGTSWYVINDQYCKKSPNGQYVYQDEDGNEQILLLQGTRQKVIKITLDWNDHLYSGIVTENQISSQQQILTIDDLYVEIVEELKNHKEIQEGPIKLKIQQGKTIEFQYSYEVKVSKQTKKYFTLQWNLVKQEETLELILEKKLKNLRNNFNNTIQELRKQILELQQRVYKEKKTVHDLQKTKGFFSVLPQSLTGVIVIQFRIKVLPQNGLVLGLDHTTNPVQNTPAYGIFLNHQVLVVGQDQKSFEYVPQVGDQIYLKVDMNQRKVVFKVKQQQIVDFNLDDSEQRNLYLCVGFFTEQEDIIQYIE